MIRPLGTVSEGPSRGIQIVANEPKHGSIEPEDYLDWEDLRKQTSSRDRGSKWLKSVSDDEQRRLVQDVLELYGLQRQDQPPKRKTYRGELLDRTIGVTDGLEAKRVEVQFDGRQAHGYPSYP
jgi:hypothetical protein